MENHEEQDPQEYNEEPQPTYNFKWMLILLLVGILGSFIFANIMK